MAFLIILIKNLIMTVVEFHCPHFNRGRKHYCKKTRATAKEAESKLFCYIYEVGGQCSNTCCQMSTLLLIVTPHICNFADLNDSAIH